ncbi:MAG: SNF2-related protein [Planctomycetaceae bacterium]
MTADETPELRNVPLDVRTPDVPITGMNSALKRFPKVELTAAGMLPPPGFVPRWRPFWHKPKTVTITFPDGIEFLPPKPEPSDSGDLRRLAPPVGPSRDGGRQPKRPTRIKPPSDALSLQDRLFYVLQPPLESWLRGQELIMPFEPFSYQYEGIAWLFSQKSALLADEMGLGKTMQTITALRLLLRAGQVRRVLLVCPKPLIPNWQREFKLWAEEIPVTVIEGDSPRRRLIWQIPGSIVLLANYELVVRDMQELEQESSVLCPVSRDGLGRSLGQ